MVYSFTSHNHHLLLLLGTTTKKLNLGTTTTTKNACKHQALMELSTPPSPPPWMEPGPGEPGHCTGSSLHCLIALLF
jgi:hypothetical protein